MYVDIFVKLPSVQFSCSVVSDSLRPHESQHTRPPCPSLMSIKSVMPSSHLILGRPLLLLPLIPPSSRVFSNESTLRMRWPKYWSFSFSIIPSKEIPGMISFRMDWLYLQCLHQFSSVQFSSVAQTCPTLCDPMNHSTPGLPVHHQLPEFTQTHPSSQ